MLQIAQHRVEPHVATVFPGCSEGLWVGSPDPITLLLPHSLFLPLGAHLGQPCLGIQDTQEAVRLVYQQVQARLPWRLGDGHPGQQLSLTLLLGTVSIWLLTEPTRLPRDLI